MPPTPVVPGLALLQLMDSSFPIGTFAHSYGLEQAVRDKRVTDAAGVEAFVVAAVVMQAAGTDARAVVRAHEAAHESDLDAVEEADRALYVKKAGYELREASTATGRRLLQEVVAHEEGRTGVVPSLFARVEGSRTPGTHAVALGVVGAAFHVSAVDLAAALLFSTANTLHQAAMRLLPVSHRDAQSALHRVRLTIAPVAEDLVRSAHQPFDAFNPLQEIASMRHETAAVRFFAS